MINVDIDILFGITLIMGFFLLSMQEIIEIIEISCSLRRTSLIYQFI